VFSETLVFAFPIDYATLHSTALIMEVGDLSEGGARLRSVQGTTLQTGRSRVLFPIGVIGIFQ